MSSLTHLDDQGNARMVDVSAKPLSRRTARATGHIQLQPATLSLIRDRQIPKGDVLATARIAGIMAAKRTADIIPLCHPISLSNVQVDLSIDQRGIQVLAEASCIGQTGVEMEALTAVSAALLSIYDMCKAVDKSMEIGKIHLLEKTKEPA